MGVMSERCLHGVGLRLIWQVCWEFSPILPLPVVLHILSVVSFIEKHGSWDCKCGAALQPPLGGRRTGALCSRWAPVPPASLHQTPRLSTVVCCSRARDLLRGSADCLWPRLLLHVRQKGPLLFSYFVRI